MTSSTLFWRIGDQRGAATRPGVAEILLSDVNDVLGVRLLDVEAVEFVRRGLDSDELSVEIQGDDVVVAVEGSHSDSEFTECKLFTDSSNQLVGFELELPLRDPQFSISRILPRVLKGE